MTLNSNDYALIEQALKQAIDHGYGYQSTLHYREVLSKLQQLPVTWGEQQTMAYRTEGSAHTGYTGLAAQTGQLYDSQEDGFRFDYDDSASV